MIEDLIKNAEYHPLQEKILKVIKDRVGNHTSDTFFRVIIANYFCQLAGHMRCSIHDSFGNNTLINMYSCGIMPSGAGKNFSTSIMDELCAQFKNLFLKLSKELSQEHRETLARIKQMLGEDPVEALNTINEEYEYYGSIPWRIGKGTEAAIRQARKQIQLAGCGSLNIFVDEIGHNLIANDDLNRLGLELYDKGSLEASITKATKENTRYEERDIPIPVNFLWMGDPTRLFDSSDTEKTFMQFLSSGFARRMFFALGFNPEIDVDMTPERLYAIRKEAFNKDLHDAISNDIASLANKNYYNKQIILNENEHKDFVFGYELACKQASMRYTDEADSTYKIELEKRFYKCIRLAGAYAFMDKADEIKPEHLLAAYKLAEDCGQDLWKILHQEKPYVKIAKFLVKENVAMHRADLGDRLPFFKGSKQAQDQMLDRAREWAYTHHVTIKTITKGKIDFFKADPYKETDLDHLIVGMSSDRTYRYENREVQFLQLQNFGKCDGFFWTTHHFIPSPSDPQLGNYRDRQYVKNTFNLIVLDFDDGDSIASVKDIFKEYKYVIYTTTHHMQPKHDKICERFRLILPIKYTISLDEKEYPKFMSNFYESIPFNVDEGTKDIARAWATAKSSVIYVNNEGDLIDPRPYLPDTIENEQRIAENKKYGNVTTIERWFLQRIAEGNRNNMLIRFGFLLKDRGMDIESVEKAVANLNSKIDIPLPEEELETTIYRSLEK